jgi:hypothetical protein
MLCNAAAPLMEWHPAFDLFAAVNLFPATSPVAFGASPNDPSRLYLVVLSSLSLRRLDLDTGSVGPALRTFTAATLSDIRSVVVTGNGAESDLTILMAVGSGVVESATPTSRYSVRIATDVVFGGDLDRPFFYFWLSGSSDVRSKCQYAANMRATIQIQHDDMHAARFETFPCSSVNECIDADGPASLTFSLTFGT